MVPHRPLSRLRGRDREGASNMKEYFQSPSPQPSPASGGGGRPSLGLAGQYAALYCSSDCLSSSMMVAGSPPALRTLPIHCCSSGSADFFHSLSCALVIG